MNNTVKKIAESAREVGWTTKVIPACDKNGTPSSVLYFSDGTKETCSIIVRETEKVRDVLRNIDTEIENSGGAYTSTGKSLSELYLCVANA